MYFGEGKVLAITDSSLQFKMAFRRSSFTINQDQIIAIQKYSIGAQIGLAVASAAGPAIVVSIWGNPYDNTDEVIGLIGAGLVNVLVERIIYPMRKVNQPDSNWKLVTAR